jgi:predicted Rossmann fold nucleotide-binding protein DprA/Smf involved in DNA uptake
MKTISNYAFANCTGISNVYIASSVTDLGVAFYGCTGLVSIDVSEDNPNYTSVDGVVFSKDEKVLYSMVDFSPKSLDEILGKSSFSEVRTLELLVNLQLKGYIREVGRNRYVRSELG